VLAYCLIRAFRSRDKSRESVYRSTYGMLFFGTPHRGSVKDGLLKMVQEPGNPRQLSLRQTEPGADVLRMQLDDFTDIIGDRKIASFYETELTPTPEKVSSSVLCIWLRC
jgi:protein SERAC1